MDLAGEPPVNPMHVVPGANAACVDSDPAMRSAVGGYLLSTGASCARNGTMTIIASPKLFEQPTLAIYDVSDRLKSWGRRGILFGGLAGFALGMALVAIPHSASILTFGVVGTLIVGAVEGAVIAGAFAACAAALYRKGAVLSGAAGFDLIPLSSGRRMMKAGWRDGDIPLSKWPTRWTYPISAAVPMPPLAPLPVA